MGDPWPSACAQNDEGLLGSPRAVEDHVRVWGSGHSRFQTAPTQVGVEEASAAGD